MNFFYIFSSMYSIGG